jgi:hypothetical protein
MTIASETLVLEAMVWLRARVPWYRRRQSRTVPTQWEGPLSERERRQMHDSIAVCVGYEILAEVKRF